MLIHFMYCRKSSEDEERQVISNESQEDELGPLAKRDGLVVRDRITEEASAKTSGTRSRFNEMIRRVRYGEANAILCWHLNRLSRNAGDAAVLVELMDQGKLLEIRTPSQAFRNTPADKFLIILFCGQAKLENDNKSEDVERGLRKKAAMGWYPGVAPLGYLNDKTKLRGERDLYKDPERFDLVKRMWRMMLAGTHTPSQILKIASDEWGFRTRRTRKQGGNPLGITGLYHIFHNPFYCGTYEYPLRSGKWYEGKHEPMVTREEFDRVQTILGRKGNPRASKNLTFAFTGIIQCGACHGTVTAEEKLLVRCTACRLKFSYRNRDACPRCDIPISQMSGPRLRRYTYYHCSRRKAKCTEKSLELGALEKQIQSALRRIRISAAFKKWAFQYLQEIHHDDLTVARQVTGSRDRAYLDCEQRLANLVKLKTSPGNADGSLISDEEYSKRRRELLQEKAALGSPEDMKRSAEWALRQSEDTFEFAESAERKFRTGDCRVKKGVLVGLGSNQILVHKRLMIQAKKPLALIEAFKSGQRDNSDGIEPENGGLKSERDGSDEPHFSRVLRDVKEVRTTQSKYKLVKDIYRYFRNGGAEVHTLFGPHWRN